MNICFRLIILWVVVYATHFVYLSSTSAELVEPTRNLAGQKAEAMGRLTVLSEPPGLKVSLDGKRLGKTPAFMVKVKPGTHNLRVKNSKTEIYLEPGKTLKISLFKNEFILIPVEVKTPQKKLEPREQRKAFASEPVTPSPEAVRIQESRERTMDRWMRFVDGTSPTF